MRRLSHSSGCAPRSAPPPTSRSLHRPTGVRRGGGTTRRAKKNEGDVPVSPKRTVVRLVTLTFCRSREGNERSMARPRGYRSVTEPKRSPDDRANHQSPPLRNAKRRSNVTSFVGQLRLHPCGNILRFGSHIAVCVLCVCVVLQKAREVRCSLGASWGVLRDVGLHHDHRVGHVKVI